MSRQVTEMDFRKPEFRHEKVEDYEFRDDGAIVRKDRWVSGMRQISSIMGNRGGFEIEDVVSQVLTLKGNWQDADPEEDPSVDLIDVRLSCGSILAGCERTGEFAYYWPFGTIELTAKDFGADAVEWKLSDTKPTQ